MENILSYREKLEETAYYMAADAMSKPYARMVYPTLSKLTTEELENFCKEMAYMLKVNSA